MQDAGGNSIINVILLDDLTLPATLTMYTGSAGNCIWLGDIQSSDADMNDSSKVYKSNDKVVRAIDHEYEGITKGKLMERTLDILNWNLKIGRANEKILEIQNLGYNNGSWYETMALVNKNAQMKIALPGAIGSNEYESHVIVPDTAIVLTTTFLVLINTTLTNMAQKIKGIVSPTTIDTTYGITIVKT